MLHIYPIDLTESGVASAASMTVLLQLIIILYSVRNCTNSKYHKTDDNTMAEIKPPT